MTEQEKIEVVARIVDPNSFDGYNPKMEIVASYGRRNARNKAKDILRALQGADNG